MKINVLENCEKCGKPIEWDEYANNFGWCNDCLTKDYKEYLKKQNIKKEQ